MAGGTPTAAYAYLALDDAALIAQCEVDHYRSRGPGGQKRNKTSSATRVRHLPTGLAGSATEDRSQHVNKIRALRRLREAIALHVRTELDPEGYEPTAALRDCLVPDGRLRLGPRHPEYYRAVAEILDVLHACDARVSTAATCLGLSTAGLVKLLRSNARLWQRVGEMRTAAGVKPLR